MYLTRMYTMKKWLSKFICEEEAATSTEYAVILALILMAVVGAVGAFGSQTAGLWGAIETSFDTNAFGS